MAISRHEIRGGTPLDYKHINDNFTVLWYDVYGNSKYAQKIKAELDAIAGRVTDAEGNISTVTQTATDINLAINTTTHSFTASGYILKDDNGETLITPNGMANEQNITVSENIESGYPLMLDFNISSAVSSIAEFILQVSQKPFRTYSKGAASGGGTKTSASGGGSTSGASSKTTADSNSPTSFYTNTQTQLSYPNEANHYHLIDSSQMSHGHGMAHTHSTPNHTHDVNVTHDHTPVYGILETAKADNNLTVWVDHVNRGSITAEQATIDLTAYVTTPGWHLIELTTSTLKKVTATAFMKSYIRR